MKFLITAHEAPNGDLLLSVNASTQAVLKKFKAEIGDAFGSDNTRFDIFEEFVCNSEYGWVSPNEIGALTDAPILGLKGESGEFGDVIRAWAYMDYALRSPQDELAEKGRVRFLSGD